MNSGELKILKRPRASKVAENLQRLLLIAAAVRILLIPVGVAMRNQFEGASARVGELLAPSSGNLSNAISGIDPIEWSVIFYGQVLTPILWVLAAFLLRWRPSWAWPVASFFGVTLAYFATLIIVVGAGPIFDMTGWE